MNLDNLNPNMLPTRLVQEMRVDNEIMEIHEQLKSLRDMSSEHADIIRNRYQERLNQLLND